MWRKNIQNKKWNIQFTRHVEKNTTFRNVNIIPIPNNLHENFYKTLSVNEEMFFCLFWVDLICTEIIRCSSFSFIVSVPVFLSSESLSVSGLFHSLGSKLQLRALHAASRNLDVSPHANWRGIANRKAENILMCQHDLKLYVTYLHLNRSRTSHTIEQISPLIQCVNPLDPDFYLDHQIEPS